MQYFSTLSYFDIQLYMFRIDFLSITRSLDTVFTAIGVLKFQYDIHQLLWIQYPDSWWWTVSLSETCRVVYQNKIKLRNSASCWLPVYEHEYQLHTCISYVSLSIINCKKTSKFVAVLSTMMLHVQYLLYRLRALSSRPNSFHIPDYSRVWHDWLVGKLLTTFRKRFSASILQGFRIRLPWRQG